MFTDSAKIKVYSQIQNRLCNLEPNCKEEEIDKIIDLIPKSYLTQKDELLIICRMFAYYNNLKTTRRNGIRLFERIMTPIKTYLQDQSVFFWKIFDGINILKQWMYEEGLITIDVIIQSALLDKKNVIAEYFLPEIIEREPELFEKQFKNNIKTPYTKEYINEFKELRQKLFKWYKESNDFKDPFYLEIEKNQLRLSIKTDNVDQFQMIISNLNISFDYKITESIIEESHGLPFEEHLIDYVIEYNAINIFKYLIMNNTDFTSKSPFFSICFQNYEIIHQVELKNEEYFKRNSINDSILSWNIDIINYIIENYDFEFIDKENVEPEYDEKILEIIHTMCFSMNFEFLDKILLSFLLKNPRFVKDNIHQILSVSFVDQSLFFAKEFLKFPGIDINYVPKGDDNNSLLYEAIQFRNANAVEFLLNDPNIDIKNSGSSEFLPFSFACGMSSYKKIIELFFKHPKFDIYSLDSKYHFTGFTYCAIKGCFYGIQSILDHYPDYNERFSLSVLSHCLSCGHLMCAKILLTYYFNKNKPNAKERLIKKIESDDFIQNKKQLYELINEITNSESK